MRLNQPILHLPGQKTRYYRPFTLRGVTIRNRVFSTGHALSHAMGGKPTSQTLHYQMEKAKGGIGLSFVGGSATISADTAPVFDQFTIDPGIIPFFQELSQFYHDQGATLFTQITHLGRRTNANAGEWLPVVAPSPVREVLHRGFPAAWIGRISTGSLLISPPLPNAVRKVGWTGLRSLPQAI